MDRDCLSCVYEAEAKQTLTLFHEAVVGLGPDAVSDAIWRQLGVDPLDDIVDEETQNLVAIHHFEHRQTIGEVHAMIMWEFFEFCRDCGDWCRDEHLCFDMERTGGELLCWDCLKDKEEMGDDYEQI